MAYLVPSFSTRYVAPDTTKSTFAITFSFSYPPTWAELFEAPALVAVRLFRSLVPDSRLALRGPTSRP
ncbi:hypothetical protein GCM10009527_028420 [Actinomadura nitritigenes]